MAVVNIVTILATSNALIHSFCVANLLELNPRCVVMFVALAVSLSVVGFGKIDPEATQR